MISQPKRTLVSCALTLVLLVASCGSAWAGLITGSQEILGTGVTDEYTHNNTTYGPYEWTYTYLRSFDGTSLTKQVGIQFWFLDEVGWNESQQDAYRATTKANIEYFWNGHYSIRDNGTGILYPITVEVITDGSRYDQDVVLFAGSGRADMTSWYVTDRPQINAHEFGHMLGLHDEYIGGAINQYPNPQLSSDGIMGLGALLNVPVMYPRYYQQYLDFMYELNPTGSFALVAVPEPATWVLFVLGGAALVVIRRRRKR